MTVKPIPEGLHTITPQLTVDGASDAIALYARAFGAEEKMRAADPSGKKIWHAEIAIGTSRIFVNDTFDNMGDGGKSNPSQLWLYTDNVDALWKRATATDAFKVRMPLNDTFWGDRMGALVDTWGNQWTLSQHIKDMTPAEMKAAQDAFIASMKK